MSDNLSEDWKQISREALKSAIRKLNRISLGRWSLIKDNEVSPTHVQEDYESVCVYFEVKHGKDKINFALFFKCQDVKILSQCFVGYSFFTHGKMRKVEEFLISEIANILLNSMINVLCNKLKIRLIPSVPEVTQMDKKLALEIIREDMPENREKFLVSSRLGIDCEGEKIFCEVLSSMPADILKLLKISC